MTGERPSITETPVPLWAWALAASWVLSMAAWAALAWSRFAADFVPLDSSRVGPNLTAWYVQGPVTAIVAMVLWPVTRRAIHRFADEKATALREHISAEHARAHQVRLDADADLHAKLDEAHRLIRHLIAHSDVPDLPPKPD